MRSAKLLTCVFILATLALVAIYDLSIMVFFGAPGTISEVCRAIGERWGLFPYLIVFAMGVLFGHIFLFGGPVPPNLDTRKP